MILSVKCDFCVISRLMDLEKSMVGGEQAKNKEMKAKREKKKEHAEARSEKILGNWKAYFNSRPNKSYFRQVQLKLFNHPTPRL